MFALPKKQATNKARVVKRRPSHQQLPQQEQPQTPPPQVVQVPQQFVPPPQPTFVPQPVYVPPVSPPSVPYSSSNPFAPVVNQPNNWVSFNNSSMGISPAPQPVGFAQQQAQVSSPAVSQQAQAVGAVPIKGNVEFSDLLNMVNKLTPAAEEAKRKKKEEEDRKKKEEEEQQRRWKQQQAEVQAKREAAERIRKQQEEQEKRKKEAEERQKKEEQERVRREEERKREEQERAHREEERLKIEQERIKKIVQEETSNEIRELKLRIVELENQLEREREKNGKQAQEITDLKQIIEQLQQDLAQERQSNAVNVQIQKDKEGKNVAQRNELTRKQATTHFFLCSCPPILPSSLFLLLLSSPLFPLPPFLCSLSLTLSHRCDYCYEGRACETCV